MPSLSVEKSGWSWQRWVVATALILAVQVGAILALGERDFSSPRPQPAIITMAMRTAPPGVWSGLNDPTLFALPHREGFSGHAWVRFPTNEPVHTEWSAPANPLTLATQYLGRVLGEYVRTNSFEPPDWLASPPAGLVWPEVEPPSPALASSTVTLEGDLTGRPLVGALSLPVWTNSVALTNSVVRLVVDAQGRPFSILLVRPGSGSEAADARALELAKSARFAPLHKNGTGRTDGSADGLSFGSMIFQWYTVPGTNAVVRP